MILHDYCRSSAAYRVRIALNLKSLPYQQHSVNLLSAEQTSDSHLQRNTQQLVPVLSDKNVNLSQSMAICEYLDEAYPDTLQLITGDYVQRAKIRAFAQAIACEVHPLNNLRVLNYLVSEMGVDEAHKMQWYHHWINTTFSALEKQLGSSESQCRFVFSDKPSLAEVCLIPQIFNAHRFDVDMTPYPLLRNIDQQCQALESFQRAHPHNQCDP